MKLKIVFLVLMMLFTFGCSSILTSLSSNDITLIISKISGDEIEISQRINDEDKNKRDILETKNSSAVGYVKIENVIKSQTSSSLIFDSSKNNALTLVMEVKIDKTYLESTNNQFDQILIWIGSDSVKLYTGVENNNKNIKENKFDDFSIFYFNFNLNKNAKKYDFSVQSLNLIK